MLVVGQGKLCVTKLSYTLTSSRKCLASRRLPARTAKPSAKMRSLSKGKVTDFSVRNLGTPLLHTPHSLFCGQRSSPQAFSSQLSAHAFILRASTAETPAFPSIRVSPTNLHKPKLNLLPSPFPYLWLVWPQPEGLFPKFCQVNVTIRPYNWEREWMDLGSKWEVTPSCLRRKSFTSHVRVWTCAHVRSPMHVTDQILPICNRNRQIWGRKFLPLPCVTCTKHIILSYFPLHF